MYSNTNELCIFLVLSMFVEFIRICILNEYCNVFFENKASKKTRIFTFTISWIAMIAGYIIIQSQIIYLVLSFLVIFYVISMCNGSWKKKVLLSTLCWAISYSSSQLGNLLYIHNQQTFNYQQVSYFATVLIFYIAVIILSKLNSHKNKKEFSGQWYVLVILAVLSIAAIYILSRDQRISQITSGLIGFILFLINYILYYFYQSMLDRFTFEQENQRLKEQMAVYESQIRVNIDNDRAIRSIRHDMKHHIREIYALSSAGKCEEINHYIDRFSTEISKTEVIANSGNIVLDGIINYMLQKAQNANITFTKHLIVPEDLELEDYDINIILGNLIDNALENTAKTENPSVDVDIRFKQGALYMIITNTYNNMIQQDHGHIMTTKTGDHGYGLDNVKKVVEKYDGQMKIEQIRIKVE